MRTIRHPSRWPSQRWRRLGTNRGKDLGEVTFTALMLAPALVLVAGTLLFPLVYSFWTSLSAIDLSDLSFHFIGLGNYTDAIQAPFFWASVTNTLLFAAITIAGTLLVGLGMALILNEQFRGRTFLRMVIVIPWAVSQVVVAVAWGWIYDGTYGLLNAVLSGLGVIHTYRGWLSDPHLALYLVSVAYIWSAVPFAAIMFLAALQGVPQDLYRAARVDGAGALRRFTYVTLPSLRYATLVVLIVASLDGLLAFTLIYTLTGGGPGTATTVLSWLAYQTTFQQLQLGEGAAMFYMLLFAMLGLAVVYIRLLHRPQRS